MKREEIESMRKELERQGILDSARIYFDDPKYSRIFKRVCSISKCIPFYLSRIHTQKKGYLQLDFSEEELKHRIIDIRKYDWYCFVNILREYVMDWNCVISEEEKPEMKDLLKYLQNPDVATSFGKFPLWI